MLEIAGFSSSLDPTEEARYAKEDVVENDVETVVAEEVVAGEMLQRRMLWT